MKIIKSIKIASHDLTCHQSSPRSRATKISNLKLIQLNLIKFFIIKYKREGIDKYLLKTLVNHQILKF